MAGIFLLWATILNFKDLVLSLVHLLKIKSTSISTELESSVVLDCDQQHALKFLLRFVRRESETR